MVDYQDLPKKLLIYRVLKAADGPLHIKEIIERLEILGVRTTFVTVRQRLYDLECSGEKDFRVKKVAPSTYLVPKEEK